MSYNFLPYAQDQDYLLPPSLKEWVREDSLAQFISDAVDHLDVKGKLHGIYAAYRADGWGRAAYHPAMMVKVLLYAYAVGIRSSREIERSLHQDVAFRFLAANQTPNFRTISDFRKDHLEALRDLFTDSLEVCAEAGLVKLGRGRAGWTEGSRERGLGSQPPAQGSGEGGYANSEGGGAEGRA
jgi:transposase